MKDQKVDVWEEFDKKYEMKNFALYDTERDMPATTNNIQDFIQTNFIAKSEVREKIENKKKKIGHILKCKMCSPNCGYNQALQDLLKELE